MTIEAAPRYHHTETPSEPNDAASGFAAVLRDRTQTVHREAERSGYIADLLRGRATRFGYAVYLRNLLPAYEAMETALQSALMMSALRSFAEPALFRTAALRNDIQTITGQSAEAIVPLSEAIAYADAVEAAASGQGTILVAHAYARFLGDLSGGQILKPLLAKTLGLEPAHLTVYDFPDVADLGACKAGLKIALDTIDTRSPEASAIIQEAIQAFRHTIAVSTAVSVAM